MSGPFPARPGTVNTIAPVAGVLFSYASGSKRIADTGLTPLRRVFSAKMVGPKIEKTFTVTSAAARLRSQTGRDAELYRKSSGSEARLSYLGHTLVENCSGLIVGTYLTEADGHAERD